MNQAAHQTIEEWDLHHPRSTEVLACLQAAAPEQVQYLARSFFQNFPCYRLVALVEGQVVGVLQFAVLPIGQELNCPTLSLDGQTLLEAKIHVFAVHPAARNQGAGRSLQQAAIRRATELDCYQLASYSMYGREANFHVKLMLGFAVQPEVHGNLEKGVYFLMPLRKPGSR
jgi:GNAT superfamily N-acetyltransferase